MEHPSIYRLGGWRGIDKNEKTEKKEEASEAGDKTRESNILKAKWRKFFKE